MKDIFLIIGAPGSGKTTDADIIAKENSDKIAHFSTGELLRDEIKSGSELGEIIDKRINVGDLVPVKIAIETIIKAINSSDKNIILIDGYPRSVEQMMSLDEILSKEKNINLAQVIEVLVSIETARQRVLGRARGNDDKEEVFVNRMKIYAKPLIEIENFYQRRNLLSKIDGEKNINEIVKNMKDKIHEYL